MDGHLKWKENEAQSHQLLPNSDGRPHGHARNRPRKFGKIDTFYQFDNKPFETGKQPLCVAVYGDGRIFRTAPR